MNWNISSVNFVKLGGSYLVTDNSFSLFKYVDKGSIQKDS